MEALNQFAPFFTHICGFLLFYDKTSNKETETGKEICGRIKKRR